MPRSNRHLAVPESSNVEMNAEHGSHRDARPQNGEPKALGIRFKNRGPQAPTFLDILDFVHRYQIPFIDIGTRVGVPDDLPYTGSRLSYALGTGYTATVFRHKTDESSSHVVPEGTTIALKAFRHAVKSDGTLDGRVTRNETYQSVLRELKVLCHPILSEHPNVVKLLFLGWQGISPYPLFALELGKYGSLDYVLRAPGFGPSLRQKVNLTIDIALGLHALHENGIVHGDLKPENIVVLEHQDPQRQIVGKLTDFGGTCRLGRQGPGHITPLWCAPEVLHGDPDVEWDKADVYSYGLVVASMLCRLETYFEPETASSSCILSSFVPEVLEGNDHNNSLLIMKSLPEDAPESALSRVLSCLSGLSKELGEELLKPIIQRQFWRRPSIFDIIRTGLQGLAADVARDIFKEVTSMPDEPRFTESRFPSFKVWSAPFRDQSREFQEHVLGELQAQLDNNPKLFSAPILDLPEELDQSMSSDAYLELLMETHAHLFRSAFDDKSMNLDDAQDQSRIAFHISMCYFLSLGTYLDLDKAVEWLQAAILGGSILAQYFAPVLHHVHGKEESKSCPLRLLLGLGALSRSLPCLELLASEYPSHYAVVQRVIKERGLQFFDRNSLPENGLLVLILRDYRKATLETLDSRSPLQSIKSYDLHRVRRLLEGGANMHETDQTGLGILHGLSYIRDSDAVTIAKDCVEKGVPLDTLGPIASALVWEDRTRAPRGSALMQAIRHGNEMLAKLLIDSHLEKQVPVPDYFAALLTSLMHWHGKVAGQLFELKREKPSLCQGLYGEKIETSAGSLFRYTMAGPGWIPLERRVKHGTRHDAMYASTLQVLLTEGFDPTVGFSTSCAVYYALVHDDATALRVFISYVKKQKTDPVAYMTDPGHYKDSSDSNNLHTAMQTCLYSKARRAFLVLLEEFPELINVTNARGLTALHSATFFPEHLDLLEMLLDRGANVLATSKDKSTPLFTALRNRNLKAADLIYRACSPEQLELLFSRDSNMGRSMFSSLVDAWHRDRDPDLIESFRWVSDHGGSHFYGRTITTRGKTFQVPLWNDILCRTRPPSRPQQLQDLALLELLFSKFKERLNVTQSDGRGPIHIATWYGHTEVVRSLLKSGADVNLEHSDCLWHSREQDKMTGKTALDIANIRSTAFGIPHKVSQGGYVEIRNWEKDMQTIVQLLLEHGGDAGSGASAADFYRTLALKIPHVHFASMNEPEPFQFDERLIGSWPEPLPPDDTSAPMPDLDELSETMDILRQMTGAIQGTPAEKRKKEEERLGEDYREILHTRAGHMHLIWRLPGGWEVRTLESGRPYFVDHNTKSTGWNKPPLVRDRDAEDLDKDSLS